MSKIQKIINMAADPSNEDQQKQRIKAAIREMIDDAMSEFGKWTLKTIATAAAGWLLYMWIYWQIHGGEK